MPSHPAPDLTLGGPGTCLTNRKQQSDALIFQQRPLWLPWPEGSLTRARPRAEP